MLKLPRPVDLLNAAARITGLEVTHNVPYGSGARQKLDIYRPKSATGLPVILFFYGGSWQFGHRSDYKFVAATLARQGFIVAIPDYRLYPDVKFPDFLFDSAAATAHVTRNLAEFGGDPDKIFLLGHSAGAYNAMMLALNPDFLGAHGMHPGDLAGVAGLAGPYDFLPLRDPKIKDIFSPPSDIKLTQPVIYASESAPPVFLAHGGADITVLPRNTTALGAKLRAAGAIVETRIYPRLGHTGLLLATLPLLAWRAPVLRDVLAFIAACRDGHYAGSGLATPMVSHTP